MRSAWLMSVAFVAAVFGWFGVAIGEFTGTGSVVGIAILLLAAPLLQPQFLVLALVRRWVGARHGLALRALAGASAWVAGEWLLPHLLGDTLGHGLYPSAHYRQAAALAGAAGLSFVLVLINECLCGIVQRRREGIRRQIAPALVVLALLACGWGYGSLALAGRGINESDSPSLRVGMVQSNIYDYERLRQQIGAYAVVREVLDTHYALSREAVEGERVDALLWSETVYPTTFGHPKGEGGAELDREILDFVKSAGVPLVFGTYDIDNAGEYNAAAFVEPSAGLIGFYRKTNAFPLTEHVPAWLDSPLLRRLLPWAGTWQPGNGARVFPLRLADGREIPVLPLICLDDVDTELGLEGVRLGAQAILTMSNDSWFTRYPAGARLHLTVAAFRSIETRLPQFRVTANGQSAVIDAQGEIVASTGVGERKLLAGELPVGDPGQSLMVRWGDWVGRAGAGFLILLALSALIAPRLRHEDGAMMARMLDGAPLPPEDAALPRHWRLLARLLQAASWVGVAWMGLLVLSPGNGQANPLAQVKLFAALVLAPHLAAWSVRRAFAGMQGAAAAVQRPARALPGLPGQLARTYLRARALVPHWRIDHWVFKFAVFPLVPALPAFRLHQHIAYGGSFGEYYSFGLKAYLLALFIWWASWAMGMVLYAAVLRACAEIAALAATVLGAGPALRARHRIEALARLLYFLGVPAWLLFRLLYV